MDLSAEQEVSITLNAGEWSVLMYALDDVPRKKAQPIWAVINQALVKAATPEIAEAVEVEEVKPNGTKEKKRNLTDAPPI